MQIGCQEPFTRRDLLDDQRIEEGQIPTVSRSYLFLDILSMDFKPENVGSDLLYNASVFDWDRGPLSVNRSL